GQGEPWDEPVNARELLAAAAAQFEKYIIIHDRVIAPIVPLWIAFAWVIDIATFSPILIFQGGDTEMAKSAASEVVSLLTPRAYMLVEPTGPASTVLWIVCVHHYFSTMPTNCSCADRIWRTSSTAVGSAATISPERTLTELSTFSMHLVHAALTGSIYWRIWRQRRAHAASRSTCCQPWKKRKIKSPVCGTPLKTRTSSSCDANFCAGPPTTWRCSRAPSPKCPTVSSVAWKRTTICCSRLPTSPAVIGPKRRARRQSRRRASTA